jgi:hypothetical protein
MALETLTSITPVVFNEINIETIRMFTPVVFNEINIETIRTFTPVVGMKDEYKRNFICNDTVSIDNRSNQTGVYVDGGVLVPVQGNMPNNQLGS